MNHPMSVRPLLFHIDIDLPGYEIGCRVYGDRNPLVCTLEFLDGYSATWVLPYPVLWDRVFDGWSEVQLADSLSGLLGDPWHPDKLRRELRRLAISAIGAQIEVYFGRYIPWASND